MKVFTVVGNRPQFIKAAPLSAALREAEINEVVLHTGQHWFHVMSQVFFDHFGLAEPRYRLDLHTSDTAQMQPAIAERIAAEAPDIVLVNGDTSSTVAGARAAADASVPVAHVEAGLRSGDLSMPEEHNRIETDRLSWLLFSPDDRSKRVLEDEAVLGRIYVVGDVMADATRIFAPVARTAFPVPHPPRSYVIATVHRQANARSRRGSPSTRTANGRPARVTSTSRRSPPTSRSSSSAARSSSASSRVRATATRSRGTAHGSFERSTCSRRRSMPTEIHPTATVYPGTVLGDGVKVLENAVVGKQPALSPRSTAMREPLPPTEIGDGSVVSTGAIVFAGSRIGARVILGDQSCVRERVTVGDDVVLGRGSLVENDTTIGAMTKIQAEAYITAYSTLEEHVFIAPCVVTTNDNFMGRTERRHELMRGPTIRRGARVGGGAILCPGVEIGEEAFVGAGAVVTKDVPPRVIIVGEPGPGGEGDMPAPGF